MRWIMRVLETNPPPILVPKRVDARMEAPKRAHASKKVPKRSDAQKHAENPVEAGKREGDHLNNASEEKNGYSSFHFWRKYFGRGTE